MHLMSSFQEQDHPRQDGRFVAKAHAEAGDVALAEPSPFAKTEVAFDSDRFHRDVKDAFAAAGISGYRVGNARVRQIVLQLVEQAQAAVDELRAADDIVPSLGMFSPEGALAVDAELRPLEVACAYHGALPVGIEQEVEALQKRVAAAGHREVDDTEVREAIWARLHDAAARRAA